MLPSDCFYTVFHTLTVYAFYAVQIIWCRFLRSAVLSAGWRFDHSDTIDTAVDMFHGWMNGSIPRCYIMLISHM